MASPADIHGAETARAVEATPEVARTIEEKELPQTETEAPPQFHTEGTDTSSTVDSAPLEADQKSAPGYRLPRIAILAGLAATFILGIVWYTQPFYALTIHAVPQGSQIELLYSNTSYTDADVSRSITLQPKTLPIYEKAQRARKAGKRCPLPPPNRGRMGASAA